MKRFASALSSSYVALLAQLLLQLWFLPHLLDAVGSRMAGVYLSLVFFLSLIGVSVGWVAAPASNLIARAEARGSHAEASRIFGAITHLFLGSGLLVFFMVALCGRLVVRFFLPSDSPEMQNELFLTLFYGAIQFLFVWLFAADVVWLRAKLHDATVSLLRLIGTMSVFLTLWATEGAWTVPSVMAAQIVGPLVSYLGGKFAVHYVGKPQPGLSFLPDWSAIRELLRVVGPGFAFMSLLQGSAASLDALVIGALVGAHAVTDMTVIFKIGDVAALLLERALDVVIPFIAKLQAHARFDAIRRLYLAVSRLLLSVGIVGATLYSFFASSIATLWVGGDHVPSIPSLFIIASFVLLTRVINRWEISMEIAYTSVSGLAQRQSIEVLLRLVLFLFFLPSMGVAGALLAMSISQLFAFLFFYRPRVLSRNIILSSVYLREVVFPGLLAGLSATTVLFLTCRWNHSEMDGLVPLVMKIAIASIAGLGTLSGVLWLLERRGGLIPLQAIPAVLSEASDPTWKVKAQTAEPQPLG